MLPKITVRSLITAALVGFALSLSLHGCGVLPSGAGSVAVSPAQRAINDLHTAYSALNSAVLSADAAVDAGVLKGQDARNVRDGFVATRKGLDASLAGLKSAMAPASAPASAPK